MPRTSLRSEFEDFPWNDDKAALRAQQQAERVSRSSMPACASSGGAGYMHNPACGCWSGSFLTRISLIHWRHGLDWFHDTLVDADLANNAMGWQWVAGSGIDAAPISPLRPDHQAERFDPEGDYVRRFVRACRHAEEMDSQARRSSADVTNRCRRNAWRGYPNRLSITHEARERALEGFFRQESRLTHRPPRTGAQKSSIRRRAISRPASLAVADAAPA
ncbi:MAG: FAD-binding domain-containing protein [Geminicoccaceae bacterium]